MGLVSKAAERLQAQLCIVKDEEAKGLPDRTKKAGYLMAGQ